MVRTYLMLTAALAVPVLAYGLLVWWLARSARLKAGLADFPTTQFRILFTIALVGATGLALLYCMVRNVFVNPDLLEPWLFFLFGMAGLDTAQWGLKRATAWKPAEGGPTPSESPAGGALGTSGQPARPSGAIVAVNADGTPVRFGVDPLLPGVRPVGAMPNLPPEGDRRPERYGDERDGGVD